MNNKIRLIEGYHPRKNIEYYRDYTIKKRDFLKDENLSNIESIKPYFLNNSEKFKYDYYKAVFYDKDNDEYDYIYFCIHQEIYTITTENDTYIFYRDDTVLMSYFSSGLDSKEIYIQWLSVGQFIDVFFDNDNYELVTDISIDY